MKRINQFERTDRDITNALLRLMDCKSFEKITVQDIIEEAMINRSTFYQHYTDKYAILERLQEQLMGELIQRKSQITAKKTNDLGAINALIAGCFSGDRSVLLKLFSVKCGTLDLEGKMKQELAEYFKSSSSLTDQEARILAGMLMVYLIDALKNGDSLETMPEELLELWLKLSVYFFCLEDVPGAGEKLLNCVRQMHAS